MDTLSAPVRSTIVWRHMLKILSNGGSVKLIPLQDFLFAIFEDTTGNGTSCKFGEVGSAHKRWLSRGVAKVSIPMHADAIF